MDRTSINQTPSAIAPILNLSQRVIVGIAANIHPFAQQLLLSGLGVDAIAVVKSQHPSIIARLLELPILVNEYKADAQSTGS